MLENKKAVIFDLDGTLVDSMWIWREIDIRFLGKYGFSVATYDRRDHGNMESYGFRNLYQ